MHYSEHRSLENERPNTLVSTRFMLILTRDFVFFQKHKNVFDAWERRQMLQKYRKAVQN